jgi:hypothetical protein
MTTATEKVAGDSRSGPNFIKSREAVGTIRPDLWRHHTLVSYDRLTLKNHPVYSRVYSLLFYSPWSVALMFIQYIIYIIEYILSLLLDVWPCGHHLSNDYKFRSAAYDDDCPYSFFFLLLASMASSS